MEMEMIILPDGRVALIISVACMKRIVDSSSGNPSTYGHVEVFTDIPTQINTNIGEKWHFNCSSLADFTVSPRNFREIENWLIVHDDRFKGSGYVQ